MQPVTLEQLMNYYIVLVKLPEEHKSLRIKEVINFLEDEIHYGVKGFKRMEFKNV